MKKYTVALVLCIAAALVFGTQPPVCGETVSEDFESGPGGFSEDEYFSVSDGRLHFRGDRTRGFGSAVWNGGSEPGGPAPQPYHSNYFGDFHVSADAVCEGGDPDYGYGLRVCIQENSYGTEDFVSFDISGDRYDIGTELNSRWEYLVYQQESALIDTAPGAANRLSVIKKGSLFAFFINGIIVQKTFIYGFSGGGIGAEAYQKLDAGFDNFIITSPDDAAAWFPQPGAYEMTVYGTVYIDGVKIEKTGYTVGAFGPGGYTECWGKADVVITGGEWSYHLNVISERERDITFKIWDSSNGEVYNAEETVRFETGADVRRNLNRPLEPASVSPASGTEGKDIRITLTGTGFDETTGVSLVWSSGYEKVVQSLTVHSEISLSLTLPGASAGRYSFRVFNDAKSRRLADAFTFVPDWTTVAGQYSMTVKGQAYADGGRITEEGYIIAAFGPGGNCRGKAEISISGGEENFHFPIVSDNEGEEIYFKLWDNNRGNIYDIKDRVTFSADTAIEIDPGMQLKTESLYPRLGVAGQESEATLSGTGFDENTKISLYPDAGNKRKIIGSWQRCNPCLGDPIDVAVFGDTAYVADRDIGLQIIDVSYPANPRIIGSLNTLGSVQDVVVIGDIAYVAAGGLQIIDVKDSKNPYVIGSADTPGSAQDIVVIRDMAYVADYGAGLQIISVSDPENPYIIASVDTPGSAQDVAVIRNTAYVADYDGGLQIIDVSNPKNPHNISSVDTPNYTNGVAVMGNNDYVAMADGNGGLQVVDVSDPENPHIIGSAPGYAESVTIIGDTAYVGDWRSGLQIIDVSDPKNPHIIGSADTPGEAYGIAVIGDTLYVADRDTGGLQIIDVSNPVNISFIGSLDIQGSAIDVVVSDYIAYIANGDGGFQIVDVSTPENPHTIGSLYTTGYATSVAVIGDTAYVTDYDGEGLLIIDVSDPENPHIIGSAYIPIGYASDVAVIGVTAYVTDNSGGLQILDVSLPGHPHIIGSIYGSASCVAVSGDTAYVTDWYYRALRIIDVSAPENPYLISSIDTPGDPYGVFVISSTAYVTYNGGLQIIDVSTPENPTTIGSVKTPGYAGGLSVIDNTAYVADNSGLQIIDVSTPENSHIIGYINTPGLAYGVSVIGDTAYVADYSGLQIIDVSVPENQHITGSVTTPSFANGLAVSGDTAYVADRDGGLQIIDVSAPENPRIIGSADTPGYAQDVVLIGDTAYVAAGKDGGLQIIDVSIPEDPHITGYIDTPNYAYGVAVINDMAYVADGEELLLIDVHSSTNLQIIGSVKTSAYDIAVIGDIAYIANGYGVQIIDVSVPINPSILGSADTPGFAKDIVVIGDTAYVAAGKDGGLQIIDVSDPNYPKIISSIDIRGDAEAISIIDNKAYVADINGSLQIIDVSAPENPYLIVSIDIPGSAHDVVVIDDMAYIANGNGGLAIIHAAITYPIDGSLQAESKTRLSFTLPAPQTPGHYIVRVTNRDESYELPGAITLVAPENSYLLDTKAIIVAGSSGSDNQIWQETKMAADYAYNALLYQGYTAESIYYLSSDPDSENADAPASFANLSYAVNQWTKEDPPATELLLFFADHGDKEEFVISPGEKLGAAELDRWLDAFQIPHDDSEPVPVTFIYDACRSGTFVSRLTPPPGADRIVITSAWDEPAWYLGQGTLSFSYQFWDAVYKGKSVGEAFLHARDQMESWQAAQMDADGDGIGNETEDEARASEVSIRRGYRPETHAPYIYDVSDPQIVYHGTSAEIWAAVSYKAEDSEIRRVWAVITPPSFYPGSPDIPVSDLPEAELTDPDHDGIYTGTYNGFEEKGEYAVKLCAVSKEGVYALFRDTLVRKSAQYVAEVSGKQVLYGENTASVRAVVNPGEDGTAVTRVWAEIMPPVSDPEAVLELNDPDGNGIYEAAYENFTAEGTYIVSVYSRDSEGFVCPPVTTSVRRAPAEPEADGYEPDDTWPKASIANIGEIRHHTFHDSGDSDWLAFFGVAGTVYRISAEGPGDCDPVIEIQKAGESEPLLIQNDTGPGAEEAAEWTCLRSDLYYISLKNANPEVFGKDVAYNFSIHSPAASETGTVSGTVTDIYGKPISGAGIMTGSGGSALSRYDGTYTLKTAPGSTTLTASADGYERTKVSVIVKTDGTATQNIVMMPVKNSGTNLRNALFILHLITGDAEYVQAPDQSDVNGDGKIGLEEAIHFLKLAIDD
jgi:hypothetical protein